MFDMQSVPDEATVAAFARVVIQCPGAPEPMEDTPQLKIWRRHHGVTGIAAIHPRLAQEAHDPVVVQMIRTALEPFADQPCGLVYVTSGFPMQYRSPVLPHLLTALPTFASIASLRHDADATLPAEALRLAEAVLCAGELCLLIHDRTRRLVEIDDAAGDAGGVDFTLLKPRATPATSRSAHSQEIDFIPEGTLQ